MQRLVGRLDADDVVAGGEEGVHEEEDPLLWHHLEHLVGIEAPVAVGNRPAEQGMAGALGVAQPEIIPQRPGFVVGHRQQLAEPERLAVRARQQETSGELVASEVALESEGFDLHRRPPVGTIPHGVEVPWRYHVHTSTLIGHWLKTIEMIESADRHDLLADFVLRGIGGSTMVQW